MRIQAQTEAAIVSKKARKYDNTARQATNIAGECVMCIELLKISGRQSSTRVYGKKGTTRYCICDNCHHTWKRVVVIESKS